MDNLQNKLNELDAIMVSDNPDRENLFKQKVLEIKASCTSASDMELIAEHIKKGYRQLSNDLKRMDEVISLREQLGEVYDLIPVSYIARNYFGKSPAWLMQRLGNYKVRGKIYTLKDDEIDTLNFALQDISRKIGATTITR